MIIFKGKLVRDLIPTEISSRGRTAVLAGPVDDELFERLLREKLVEEANEVLSAPNDFELIEELADLREVYQKLCALRGITLEVIRAAQTRKAQRKGQFFDRVMLICSTGEYPSDVREFGGDQ